LQLTCDSHAHSEPLAHVNLAVLTVIRNRASVVQEFISHYIEQGAFHIYIIDDDSNDGLANALHCVCSKLFTVWAVRDLLPSVIATNSDDGLDQQWVARQLAAYSSALSRLRHNTRTDWLVVVDCDEFIVSRACPMRRLESLLANELRHCDYVAMPWLMFGMLNQTLEPCGFLRNALALREPCMANGSRPTVKDPMDVGKFRDRKGYMETKYAVRLSAVISLGVHNGAVRMGSAVCQVDGSHPRGVVQTTRGSSRQPPTTIRVYERTANELALAVHHYRMSSWLGWNVKAASTMVDKYGRITERDVKRISLRASVRDPFMRKWLPSARVHPSDWLPTCSDVDIHSHATARVSSCQVRHPAGLAPGMMCGQPRSKVSGAHNPATAALGAKLYSVTERSACATALLEDREPIMNAMFEDDSTRLRATHLGATVRLVNVGMSTAGTSYVHRLHCEKGTRAIYGNVSCNVRARASKSNTDVQDLAARIVTCGTGTGCDFSEVKYRLHEALVRLVRSGVEVLSGFPFSNLLPELVLLVDFPVITHMLQSHHEVADTSAGDSGTTWTCMTAIGVDELRGCALRAAAEEHEAQGMSLARAVVTYNARIFRIACQGWWHQAYWQICLADLAEVPDVSHGVTRVHRPAAHGAQFDCAGYDVARAAVHWVRGPTATCSPPRY